MENKSDGSAARLADKPILDYDVAPCPPPPPPLVHSGFAWHDLKGEIGRRTAQARGALRLDADG